MKTQVNINRANITLREVIQVGEVISLHAIDQPLVSELCHIIVAQQKAIECVLIAEGVASDGEDAAAKSNAMVLSELKKL